MLQGASDWLYVYPRGLWDLLLHIKRNYNNPLIYITENGTLINMIFFFPGGFDARISLGPKRIPSHFI